MTVAQRLEETIKDRGLTQIDPPLLKRLIPGFSSSRRINLQTYSDVVLANRGFDEESVNHSPWLDDLSALWDISLLASYSVLASRIYDYYQSL
jgi:hypothetical protein